MRLPGLIAWGFLIQRRRKAGSFGRLSHGGEAMGTDAMCVRFGHWLPLDTPWIVWQSAQPALVKTALPRATAARSRAVVAADAVDAVGAEVGEGARVGGGVTVGGAVVGDGAAGDGATDVLVVDVSLVGGGVAVAALPD